MEKMQKVRFIVSLLVGVLISGTLFAKRPVMEVGRKGHGRTEVERLEREIKKQPGDMDKHCALVTAQLTAGDTIEAEKSLDYALKMRETPCLFLQKAKIGVARGEFFVAARYSAQAVKAGLHPSEDSTVYQIDSLSSGGVMLCLQRMTGEEKQYSTVWRGMAEIACLKGDTLSALRYYGKALQLGDSTVKEEMTRVQTKTLPDFPHQDQDSLSKEYRIPMTGYELKGRINGLAIRITVDSAATQSTISGVETLFMLKNEYITRDDIIDNKIVGVKRLEIGEGLVLQDIRLRYNENQDSPLILTLRDLERLGKVESITSYELKMRVKTK